MPGLTRRCKEGTAFKIGEASVHIVKIGRKVTLNIIAPENVPIKFDPPADKTKTTSHFSKAP